MRLSQGESAANAMREMREHYTTPCARRNKVSLLRNYFMETYPAQAGALANVQVSAEEGRECKRSQRKSTADRQRRVTKVPNGDAIVDYCLKELENHSPRPSETRSQELGRLAICLLAVTGRRTTELLNGISTFRAVSGNPHVCVFRGQLKSKAKGAYRIPLLVPFDVVKQGLSRLKRLQVGDGVGGMNNAQVSSKYQRALSRALEAQEAHQGPMGVFRKIHELRAFYACAAYEAFDVVIRNPNGASSAEEFASLRHAVKSILGHASMSEASKYTRFRVTITKRLGTFYLPSA